jgi:Glucodextranase, domain B
MIKELLLAVVLGALLGFGITGGVVALKNSRNATSVPIAVAQPTVSAATSPAPQPSENPNQSVGTSSHQITIESPQNYAIVTNSKVTIKGSTSPGSQLVISTPSQTYFATADNAGNFNTDIEVDAGVNQIQIDSIDSQDDQATTQLIITYSTTKF